MTAQLEAKSKDTIIAEIDVIDWRDTRNDCANLGLEFKLLKERGPAVGNAFVQVTFSDLNTFSSTLLKWGFNQGRLMTIGEMLDTYAVFRIREFVKEDWQAFHGEDFDDGKVPLMVESKTFIAVVGSTGISVCHHDDADEDGGFGSKTPEHPANLGRFLDVKFGSQEVAWPVAERLLSQVSSVNDLVKLGFQVI
jgi:RimJ/RimL family protein N-acetyltransferase